MERRQILLGSGAVLATVLAGCSDTASDDGDDDGSTGSRTDDDTSSGDDNDDTGNGRDNDSDDGDDDRGDDDDRGKEHDLDEVPGIKREKIDLKKHDVTIERVGRDGKKLYVDVVVARIPKGSDEAHAELKKISEEFGNGITDRKKFRDAIEEIEIAVYDEYGDVVLAFYINVTWLIQFLEDEITGDELATKALSTAE